LTFGPSDRYYDPPDPVICCSECEDDPGHDVESCLAESAEAAGEARAERQREDMLEARYRDAA
jgi:hypothetical protein